MYIRFNGVKYIKYIKIQKIFFYFNCGKKYGDLVPPSQQSSNLMGEFSSSIL